MLTAAQGLLMVVAVAEFFVGLLGNGALVVWSLGEWARRTRQSCYSCIVLGLAACRFVLQWLIMADLSLFSLFQGSHWIRYLWVAWALVSQASLWFATFLSAFYCLKITTFEHPAYVWLKQRGYRLNLCCLGYFIVTLLLVVHISQQPHAPFQWNSSILHPFLSRHYAYTFELSSGGSLPFLLFLLYSGMLMVSLYRHHRKMQVHMAGRWDAQARAHIRARWSLGSFLVFHTVYVLASLFSIPTKSPPHLTSIIFSETLMAASPSLHSAVLVLGNPRVKQLWQRILQKLGCTCRGGGP
ncbi:LOW QUALITY PROTEIN: taste receptor type 2 member 5 [Trichechus inunguis]